MTAVALDHALLERLARKAGAGSPNPRKAKTWDAAHKSVWRERVLRLCVLSQANPIGKALVSAIWGEK